MSAESPNGNPLPPTPPPDFHGEKLQELKRKLKLQLPRGNIEFATTSPLKSHYEDFETAPHFHAEQTQNYFLDSEQTHLENLDSGKAQNHLFSEFTKILEEARRGSTISLENSCEDGLRNRSKKVDQSDSDRWQVVEYGCAGTLRYRLLLADESGRILSPWHDIPLYRYSAPHPLSNLDSLSTVSSPCSLSSPSFFSARCLSSPIASSASSFSPSPSPSPYPYFPSPTSCPVSSRPSFPPFSSPSVVRFVCTTPAGTWLQCHVAGQEPFSPIRMRNVGGIPARFSQNLEWNLGFLPQTWAGSFCRIRKSCKSRPLGVPMEAVDIGTRTAWAGEVYSLKILGAVLVVEEGERVCWRVVGISEEDKLAKKMRGLSDVARILPGRMEEVQAWLRCQALETHGEEKPSQSPLMGQTADEKVALQVVERAHATWRLHVIRRLKSLESLPMSADAYEATWQQCTSKTADVRVPLFEEEETTLERYEHAWMQSVSSEEKTKKDDKNSGNSESFRGLGKLRTSKSAKALEDSMNLRDSCGGVSMDECGECCVHHSHIHSCSLSESKVTQLYREFFSRKCKSTDKMWGDGGHFTC